MLDPILFWMMTKISNKQHVMSKQHFKIYTQTKWLLRANTLIAVVSLINVAFIAWFIYKGILVIHK